MRVVIQRVASASVTVAGEVRGRIGPGLLLLAGFEAADAGAGRPDGDMDWLCAKVTNLRIFTDDAGKMNRSVRDIGGEVLVVSQFTLFAATQKGNRPSFIRAAPPEMSLPLYEEFVRRLGAELGRPVATGEFGAKMAVSLVNDGPVTITIDTRDRE